MNAVDEKVKKSIEWTRDQVILFPAGVPGFDDARKFIIYTFPEHEPFHWLECVDGNKIRFAIINPLLFRPDYAPRVSKEELATLGITDSKDLLMYVIVTLNQPLTDSTANLMGPLFINIKKQMGKQIIVENAAYSIREKIIG